MPCVSAASPSSPGRTLVDHVQECCFSAQIRPARARGLLDGARRSGPAICRNSSRLKLRLVSASITFSISAAITLRRVKSGLSKIVRNQPLGQQVLHQHLIDRRLADVGVQRLRQSAKKPAKAARNAALACRSRSINCFSPSASSGMRSLNACTARSKPSISGSGSRRTASAGPPVARGSQVGLEWRGGHSGRARRGAYPRR